MLRWRFERSVGKRAGLAIARDSTASCIDRAAIGASAVVGEGEVLRIGSVAGSDAADVVEPNPSSRELLAPPCRPLAAQIRRDLPIE